MDSWTTIYEKKSGCRLDYVSKGSSKGVEGVILQFLDFGCSDAPLTDAQMAETGGTMLHVPLVMGAVVPICNVTNFEPVTVTLPPAFTNPGKIFVVRRVGGGNNQCIVTPVSGGNSILDNGGATRAVQLQSDGTDWWVISSTVH